MTRRLSNSERVRAMRVNDMVFALADSCATAHDVHELCINTLHAAAAAFVAACDVPTTVAYLRTLANVIESHEADERRRALN